MTTDNFSPPNSVWPNGLKRDGEGYVTFYPLGTNKIDIPDGSKWPKGAKLKFPFVYDENGQLTGLCDTKSMTNPDMSWKIYLPYKEIEADFSSIDKGTLSIHAPNATIKKAIWSDGTESDIPEAQFKYKNCKTVDDIIAVDANYKSTFENTTDNVLWDLEQGGNGTYDGGMFYDCDDLTSFNIDLPSLTNGNSMFYNCTNLESFNSDLSSLTDGDQMFYYCENLSEFDSDLSNLTDGHSMFQGCFNLTSFNIDLPSLMDGSQMFYACQVLTSFNIDLPSLTSGYHMFYDTGLESFSYNLSSLTNGHCMFQLCSNLTSFSSDLSSLTNGNSMFDGCTNLTSFKYNNLSNLTTGESMFWHCKNLESFNIDLPSFTKGNSMFGHCSNLTSFSSDLPSLTDGKYMFYNCSNLTSFSSDLPSLTSGYYMFSGCKLDAPSVKNIINTINTYSDGLTLGMGCNNTTEDKDLFAQEVGYANMDALRAALQTKGWSVTTQYNGRPTTTYGLRRPSEDTLPVFVQLEEIVEDHADYTSEDGSKKFRLDWFHETTGSTEGYTQYATLEEAIEALNIKPIERN